MCTLLMSGLKCYDEGCAPDECVINEASCMISSVWAEESFLGHVIRVIVHTYISI